MKLLKPKDTFLYSTVLQRPFNAMNQFSTYL